MLIAAAICGLLALICLFLFEICFDSWQIILFVIFAGAFLVLITFDTLNEIERTKRKNLDEIHTCSNKCKDLGYIKGIIFSTTEEETIDKRCLCGGSANSKIFLLYNGKLYNEVQLSIEKQND